MDLGVCITDVAIYLLLYTIAHRQPSLVTCCFFKLVHVYISFVSARVANSDRCFGDAGPELSVVSGSVLINLQI